MTKSLDELQTKFLEYLFERQSELSKLHDDVELEESASRAYVDYGRQLGRTTYMIELLAQYDKCIIAIPKRDYAEQLIKRIQELRPKIDLNNIEFVPVRNYQDLLKLKELRGNKRLYIDNSVWDNIMLDMIKEIYS
jgi:hypothetical protein